MNNILKAIITFIVVIAFFLGNTYALGDLNIHSSKNNVTLNNHILSIKVLDKPFIFKNNDVINKKIINYINNKGYKIIEIAKTNNSINYGVKINRDFFYKNTTNKKVKLKIEYFPYDRDFYGKYIHDSKYDDIKLFLVSDSIVKYPYVKINDKFIKGYRKFNLVKYALENPYTTKVIGHKYFIERKWYWEYEVKPFESVKLSFSYYLLTNGLNSNYGYFNFLDKYFVERYGIPKIVYLDLGNDFKVLTGNRIINGRYKGNLNVLKDKFIKIQKK